MSALAHHDYSCAWKDARLEFAYTAYADNEKDISTRRYGAVKFAYTANGPGCNIISLEGASGEGYEAERVFGFCG